MAAQDSEKREQVKDMNPRQTSETIPPAAQGQIEPGGGPGGGASLGPDLQAHIGRQLRAVYDEVVGEAVPDRFLRLLEELERKQAPRS
jgi:hypothetical protein